MKTEFNKLLSLSRFFEPKKINDIINVKLEKASCIITQNIKAQWLQFIYNKTHQNFNVYLQEESIKKKKVPYGFIDSKVIDTLNNNIVIKENNINDVLDPTELKLHLVLPKQDIMQYFIKWQRYRKFWWSSITTTPSLFLINDMKNEAHSINVNIVANFNWGPHIVENITLHFSDNNSNDTSCLICKMGVENALLTVLLDGLTNATEEGYLRLHSKLAPYKISFALNLQDIKDQLLLKRLAKQMDYTLKRKKISTWLPDFLLPLECQIKENLQLGITYTAILSDNTLKDGIFHLLNSSTMLAEQIHIADFENYATKLCRK